MRMWMIDPKLLCNKHLIGEHGEIHKFKHSFEKEHNMSKRIELGQIEPSKMQYRHDVVAEEMLKRGMNHKSPYKMPDISYIKTSLLIKSVDIDKNIIELASRCENCYKKINNEKEKHHDNPLQGNK